MKSRYRKHLQRIEKQSPIVAFSEEDLFTKGTIVITDELNTFNKHIGLDIKETYATSYKVIKDYMAVNVIMFTDNYLACGGHRFVYLLVPRPNQKYEIIEKENIVQWSEDYWKREDPENKRDWCYYDEDISDLYKYIEEKFNKHSRVKI